MQLTEPDHLVIGRGHWCFTAYEGDAEYVDCDCADPSWPEALACGRCDGTQRIALNPVVWREEADNLIVTVGKQLVLDRLYNLSAAAALANTGVGTGSGTAVVGDTTLTGGVYKVFDATPVRSGLTVTSTTTFGTTEANINIQEAALTTASPGVMLNRLAPIGPFQKSTAVSLAITVAISQA